MPAESAYPSGHLVPSPILGLANAPIVETKFLELTMSLLDFSPRIPLGTFLILPWTKHNLFEEISQFRTVKNPKQLRFVVLNEDFSFTHQDCIIALKEANDLVGEMRKSHNGMNGLFSEQNMTVTGAHCSSILVSYCHT